MSASWKWISDFIPHFNVYVITYLCWDWSWSMLVKWSPSSIWVNTSRDSTKKLWYHHNKQHKTEVYTFHRIYFAPCRTNGVIGNRKDCRHNKQHSNINHVIHTSFVENINFLPLKPNLALGNTSPSSSRSSPAELTEPICWNSRPHVNQAAELILTIGSWDERWAQIWQRSLFVKSTRILHNV